MGWEHGFIASLAFAACAEPVVELQLRAPADADQYDTSCITAVEVRAIGTDRADYTRSCIELTSPAATYGELRDMLRGRVAMQLPDSGLATVSIRGFAGPTACALTDEADADYREDVRPNLVFHAKASYDGDELLAPQVVPNLRCPTSTVSVRVVDMFALAAAGSSASCASAMSYTDRKGWSGIGTMVPKLFGKGVDYYGNVSWAQGTNNLVQFSGMMQLVPGAQRSCLALAGANETGANTACVIGGPSVCAAVGELETAAVDYRVWTQLDRTLQGNFPGVVWGSVWLSGSPKTTAAGATVSVDPEHAKVVYIDPPDASGKIAARADQSKTGPSGLFLLYADSIVSAKIAAAGKSRTVNLGAPDYTMGGVMVVLP